MIPTQIWLGAGLAVAVVVAFGFALNEAYDRGYENAEKDMTADLAESANNLLLERDSAWQRSLALVQERAEWYQGEALRLQDLLDNQETLTAADVREAIGGLRDATSTDPDCRLGRTFIQLHNTAAGASSNPRPE